MPSTVQVSATMGLASGVAAIGLAVFQLGLALGAPLGNAAWSGTIPGRLPVRLRVGSLAAALIWSFAVSQMSPIGAADPALIASLVGDTDDAAPALMIRNLRVIGPELGQLRRSLSAPRTATWPDPSAPAGCGRHRFEHDRHEDFFK
jgi:hypothetical protein